MKGKIRNDKSKQKYREFKDHRLQKQIVAQHSARLLNQKSIVAGPDRLMGPLMGRDMLKHRLVSVALTPR